MKIEMDQNSENGITAICIAAVLICMFIVCDPQCPTANAAEADTVYFTSASDLMARVDSVMAVCDTLRWADPPCIHEDYQYRHITCRELICVLKYSEPVIETDTVSTSYDGFFDDLFPTKKIPGQAIVWWREVME